MNAIVPEWDHSFKGTSGLGSYPSSVGSNSGEIMTNEDMKRWVDEALSRAPSPGRTITIPIILDPSLPPDGWYLKSDIDLFLAY